MVGESALHRCGVFEAKASVDTPVEQVVY